MEFEKQVLCDGRAVLYRGDSLRLLAEGVFGKYGAIVSDPPYGIGYQHSGGYPTNAFGLAAGGKILPSKKDTIIGDDQPFDPRPWIDAAPVARDGFKRILLFGANNFMRHLPDGGTLLAWDKHLGVGMDDSFTDCEWAWVSRKVKREVFRWLWKGVLTNKTSLEVATTPKTDRTSGKTFARVHVSQKPIELMRWCIEKVRPVPGLPVLDQYMGSGTTGVAALSLGLKFVGCEIDPRHFDVACKRIEAAWQTMGPLSIGEEPVPPDSAPRAADHAAHGTV